MKRLAYAMIVSVGLALGCAAPQEHIAMTGEGRRASPEQIDEERWGLLPAGAVLWASLDVPGLARAEYGPPLLAEIERLLPVSRSQNLELAKVVQRAHLGVYASQAGDVAAVLEGRFDAKQIQSAIATDPTTRAGEAIRPGRFAGSEVLHAGPWALVLLTPSTALLGTEVGVRRMLERVEEGRIRRALPAWFESMLENKSAGLWLGIDLDAQPVPATIRSQLTFLEKLRGARVLGGFEGGLRLAGTLSYDSQTAAERERALIEAQAAELGRATLLLSLLRVPRPLRSLETTVSGKNVQFVADFDGRAVTMAVGYLGQLKSQIALR